jgi:hypothetical protein
MGCLLYYFCNFSIGVKVLNRKAKQVLSGRLIPVEGGRIMMEGINSTMIYIVRTFVKVITYPQCNNKNKI